MSTVEPPFLDSFGGRPGDDLDGLLRTFFRSELPKPWPKAPVAERQSESATNGHAVLPFARPVRPAARSWAWTSRVALVASLGGLLLGTLLVSGHFQGNTPAGPDVGNDFKGNNDIPRKLNDLKFEESLEQ